MKRIRWRRCAGATVALAAVVLALPAPARGQSGPLTESLVLEEPKTFSFRIGPVLVSPNLTIRDFGYDTNVFNEDENPKKDWTITLTPEFQMFARLGLVQVVGLAASDLRYFKEYESERSVSRQFRGRVDAQLSRFRPWFSAAHVDQQERPNREVDLRAKNTAKELAAGLSFNLSPIAGIFGDGVAGGRHLRRWSGLRGRRPGHLAEPPGRNRVGRREDTSHAVYHGVVQRHAARR